MNIDPELWAAGCRFAGVIVAMGFGFTACGCLLVTITDYINRRDYRAWMDKERGE